MKKFKDNSFIEISMTVLQKCKKSLQYYLVYGAQPAGNKLTSCVIMPTYTLQGFVVFLSCKSEVALLFPWTLGP